MAKINHQIWWITLFVVITAIRVLHFWVWKITKRNFKTNAPVAQLDRAIDYESIGRAFESLRVRHLSQIPTLALRAHSGICNQADKKNQKRGF